MWRKGQESRSPFQSDIQHAPDQTPIISDPNNAKCRLFHGPQVKIFHHKMLSVHRKQFPQMHFFFSLFFPRTCVTWISGEVANSLPKWSIALPNNSVTWQEVFSGRWINTSIQCPACAVNGSRSSCPFWQEKFLVSPWMQCQGNVGIW